MTARRLALILLCRWEEGARYANLSLPASAETLSEQEHALLTALFYGCVERSLTLDYCIGRITRNPASALSLHTRNLLRLGLFQLLFMQGIPAFAAVSETVSLGMHTGERALCNAVLRTALRTPDLLRPPPREKNPARHLSVRESFPLWIVRHFLNCYGEEECEQILSAFNRPPALTLRVNTQKTDREALLRKWQENGVEATYTTHAPTGIHLAASVNPTRLPGFAEGEFFVQDEASQLAVSALGIAGAADALVVDCCACPGGKSFGAAIEMRGCGSLYAMDLHASKLPLIEEGAARLGLRNLHTSQRDGRTPDPALCGRATHVLCDVPCSGLGVLGKKPDLRYRPAEGLAALPKLQGEILSAAACYPRAGGVLLYSTCTLNTAENESVCSEFLKTHPEYHPEDFVAGDLVSGNGMLTLLPHRHGCDGFFMARFRREGRGGI